MVRYLFYTIGDLTYQSPLVCCWDSNALLTLLARSLLLVQVDPRERDIF